MAKVEYEAYIASPEWKAVRKRYKEEREWKCYVCGKTEGLHLHHKTYYRLGREKLEDLVPLCPAHHLAAHALVDAKRCKLKAAHRKLRELEREVPRVASYNGVEREGGWKVRRLKSGQSPAARRRKRRARAARDRERSW